MDETKRRLAELIGRALARRRFRQSEPDPAEGGPFSGSPGQGRTVRACVELPARGRRSREPDAGSSDSGGRPGSAALPRPGDPDG